MSRVFDHFFLFCTQYVAVNSESPPKYGDFIEMKTGVILDSADGLCGIMAGNKNEYAKFLCMLCAESNVEGLRLFNLSPGCDRPCI